MFPIQMKSIVYLNLPLLSLGEVPIQPEAPTGPRLRAVRRLAVAVLLFSALPAAVSAAPVNDRGTAPLAGGQLAELAAKMPLRSTSGSAPSNW